MSEPIARLDFLRASIIMERHLGFKSIVCFGKCNACKKTVDFIQTIFTGDTARERFEQYFYELETDCPYNEANQ